jgi:hypothetical protein
MYHGVINTKGTLNVLQHHAQCPSLVRTIELQASSIYFFHLELFN